MQQMREHYEAEQNHKYKLQEDMQQLKYHYEEELKKISEQEKQTLLNGKSPTFAVSSPVGGTPAEIVDALKKEKKTITPAQQEILSRLQKLQKSMVGGERANDSEAKERRMRKKRASERRLQALAQVLSKVDDDDGVVLQVYDDIEQRLRNTTETLRKYRNRVLEEKEKFQEQEKQYEIEKNKLRKDCMKYKQIAEKIAETWVPEGCNYKHIEEIKREMFFDEANQNYILPPAKFDEKRQNRTHNLLPAASPLHLHSSRSSGSSDKSSKSSSPPKNRMCSPEFLEDEDRSIIQKLQRSEEEDIAGNYFKPKRATELLNRAKEDASRAFNTWRGSDPLTIRSNNSCKN